MYIDISHNNLKGISFQSYCARHEISIVEQKKYRIRVFMAISCVYYILFLNDN